METTATLRIMQEILQKRVELIWSYVNESENRVHPHEESRRSILRWKVISVFIVLESEKILENSKKLVELGLDVRDALHLASAVEAKVDYFLTTDDKLIRKVTEFEGVVVLNPREAVEKLDEYIN